MPLRGGLRNGITGLMYADNQSKTAVTQPPSKPLTRLCVVRLGQLPLLFLVETFVMKHTCTVVLGVSEGHEACTDSGERSRALVEGGTYQGENDTAMRLTSSVAHPSGP